MALIQRKVNVTTSIFVAAIGGSVLLFAATLALVILNWSEKTLTPFLSILMVGTATTLAALLVTLKESSIESAFATSVVLDISEGAPAFIIPDANSPKLTSRLSELSMLGRPAINRDGKTVITVQKPTTEGERFTFCSELIQYRIFHIIEELQRGGWTAGMKFGTSTATVSRPMKLSKLQDYPGKTFLSVVASNHFSDSDRERFRWEHGHIPLPKNTTVSLIHIPTSPTTGVEKFIVRFEKPLYFRIDFLIEPLVGTGMGILPAGLVLPSESAARCQTYQFQVTMRATFEKITAGNAQTQEYKDWANWLFSGLKDKLTD
jgi:hypothetical protein